MQDERHPGLRQERGDAGVEQIEAIVVAELEHREGEVPRRIDAVEHLQRHGEVADGQQLVPQEVVQLHRRQQHHRQHEGRQGPPAEGQAWLELVFRRQANHEPEAGRQKRADEQTDVERVEEQPAHVNGEQPEGERHPRREQTGQRPIPRGARGEDSPAKKDGDQGRNPGPAGTKD